MRETGGGKSREEQRHFIQFPIFGQGRRLLFLSRSPAPSIRRFDLLSKLFLLSTQYLVSSFENGILTQQGVVVLLQAVVPVALSHQLVSTSTPSP